MFRKLSGVDAAKKLSVFSLNKSSLPVINGQCTRSHYAVSQESEEDVYSKGVKVPIDLKIKSEEKDFSKNLYLKITIQLTSEIASNFEKPVISATVDLLENKSIKEVENKDMSAASLQPVSIFKSLKSNIDSNQITETSHYSFGFQGV